MVLILKQNARMFKVRHLEIFVFDAAFAKAEKVPFAVFAFDEIEARIDRNAVNPRFDRRSVFEFADRIARMDDGKIIEVVDGSDRGHLQ